WARSLGRHIYFGGDFDLSQWDDEAEFAVFDDFTDNQCLVKYKMLFGAQKNVVLTDKYRRKMAIKWGKPCILLTNTLEQKYRDDPWVQGNCVIIDVEEKFWCSPMCNGCVEDAAPFDMDEGEAPDWGADVISGDEDVEEEWRQMTLDLEQQEAEDNHRYRQGIAGIDEADYPDLESWLPSQD
ncbi:hypothetical protein K503DRAFT_788101, partial [Rhizopogon vinicolor AM-OR11-026]